MPVTDITKDPENLSLTITAEFAAPVERIWEMYADPRQLEKVFGPPTYPATFVRHELRPGATTHYFMTSPEGEKFCGLMRITEVQEPERFAFEDAFADESFTPVDSMPVSVNVYAFTPVEGGTRAVYTSTYASQEALQQVLDMGMEEGSREAMAQIDAFLAAS
ncbi:SRPBCC domain-containing protein [Ornithinimicrobium sp. LYQ92]|uniref:SRPBCC family protein n=1 Tax=Serinicoccus sp. LYQ92 TaxID=3378798 RepID=UPI003854A122